jgi:hypothetical protein
MDEGTLARWGAAAKEHVTLTDKHVILDFGGDKLLLGPIEDMTKRKALWSDVQWLIARAFETASPVTKERFDRQDDLIEAAERLIALVRGVHEAPKGYVASNASIDLCLAAYDLAKANFHAPSVYDRLRDKDSLDKEPAKRPDRPAIPEPETEVLFQVLAHWKHRKREVAKELETLRAEHVRTPGFDTAPCPADLAKAYQRFFKAKSVCGYLEAAIHEQIGEHLAVPLPDGSGEAPTEFRFRMSYAFAEAPRTEPGCATAIEADFQDAVGSEGETTPSTE